MPAAAIWAFNAEPGTVHMTIRVGGTVRFEQDVTILANQATTWAKARVVP